MKDKKSFSTPYDTDAIAMGRQMLPQFKWFTESDLIKDIKIYYDGASDEEILDACALAIGTPHTKEEIDNEYHLCSQCGNCCSNCYPISLDKKDALNISKVTGITVHNLKERRIIKYNKKDIMYYFGSTPCPFLKNNLCNIYEFRPSVCRLYPFVSKNGSYYLYPEKNYSCNIVYLHIVDGAIRILTQKKTQQDHYSA